ncbi:MAG TPA: hypothetical protein EYN66_15685, partial [Myxococcales bacterium]|nr:hypothetical protein [Myxococcales bacterium]
AGGPLPTEPAAIVEDVAAAEWLIAHDAAWDRLGSALAAADINNDGVTDLLAGTYADEVPGGASNTGTINYYLGSEGAFPQTEPYRVVPAVAQDDHLGWALAVIGDLNGDGWAEVAAHARDADDWGKNSGQIYNIWGQEPFAISMGDVWKFSDQGVDHGDAWLAADFDDSEWAEGPGQLGYGDDDEATLLLDADPNIPTAYFRKTFELSSAPSWAELRVIYDDGVGVWVNGKLVFSQYMANGFDFAELASQQCQTDDQVSVIKLGVESENPLVEGLNTICVMVKQYDLGSSDLSFDLELQVHSDKLDLEAELQGLDVQMTISNSRVGYSVAVLNDVTADGLPDLVMGASLATIGGMGNRAGAAFLYRGTADGFEAQPAHMWNEFSGHHNDSYVGYQVGSADFFGDGQNDVLLVAGKLDLNVGYYDEENYTWDASTCTDKGDVGGVFVFSSVPGASLPAQEPSFVYYSHKGGGRIQALASNVDYDGDGYQDLVVSSGEWDYENANNAGGISFVRGRAPGAKSEIVCVADATFQGPKANVRMGYSLTGMGDLDGDGCDEVAVGAYLEDLGVTDQGTVRVFYGWGSKCATAQPRIALLASGAMHSESGFALHGGKDMDGDGLPDLLVGAPDYRESNQYFGAVYLVPGSYIASLPTAGLNSGSAVPEQAAQPYEQPGSLGHWIRIGSQVNERYGSGVSMIPGLGATGVAAAVAKGGDKNGLLYGGGLDVLEYRNNSSKPGLQNKAIAMLSGESYSLGGFLGGVSSGAKSGASVIMAVGGWRASPMPKNDRSDDGGVYGMLLPQSVVDEDAKGSPGFEEPEGGTTDGGEPAAATWLGGVQAILQTACASCHTIDGKGNTNFASSYTEVISNSLSYANKKIKK